MKFDIYTDGACSGNPGPGGYAFIIIEDGKETLKLSGGKKNTTNNCMELMAIVRALDHISQFISSAKKKVQEITIYSDSAYCVNSVEQGWIRFWMINGWKTKAGYDVKNKEIWQRLYEHLKDKRFKIKLIKVKGHSGNKYNEIVDKAAKEAIKKILNQEV